MTFSLLSLFVFILLVFSFKGLVVGNGPSASCEFDKSKLV